MRKETLLKRTHLTLMLVKLETASIAFLIDKVINEQEILIKLFNKQLSHVDNIAAATLLGVNETVPVLNMVDIIGNVTQKTSVRFQNDLQEEVKPAFTDTPTILICRGLFHLLNAAQVNRHLPRI